MPGAAAGLAELTTEAQLAAFLHPIRRRVLAALVEPASPADVGRQLGIPAQVANYHVRALEAAGLAREVETRQKRNLIEHRFRAIARSFALSTALPLTDAQRQQLQQDVALQQLVHTGDAIRHDALRLLAQSEAAPARHAVAAIEIELELAAGADRTAFVRAVAEAISAAAEPFRAPARTRPPSRSRPSDGPGPARYRTQIAVYPVPEVDEATPDD